MKRTVRLTAWILAVCLCAALAFAFGGSAETAKKHTTVMVYMCGTDLESKNRQATQTMGDMIAAKFNLDAVNVVILAGGSRHWSGRYDTGKLTLLTIEKRKPVVVDAFDGASMGKAETLSFFLNTCCERYPAEHYNLVLWDHGGGPNCGVCFDALYDDDSLTMQDLQQALTDSPFGQDPLDLLIFHACLMSSAEVANAVAPFARYMVAGEDSIYGLSYQWLAGVENDPDPLTTARRIVDASFEFNGKTIKAQNASERNAFAAIDLSRMTEIVDQMQDFFPKVIVNLNETSFTSMSSDRRSAVCFGVGESGPDSDFDLVDLGDLITQYRKMAENEADTLLATLGDAIYCHSDPGSGCTGLTVYHPFANKNATMKRMEAYGQLGFCEAYTEYIQQFASLLLDVPMTTWNDLQTGQNAANKATFTAFMLPLNEEQTRYLGEAKLCVLLKGKDDTYQLVSTDPKITYEEGLIRGVYDGTALYAVNAEGETLSAPLEYVIDANDNYVIPAELEAEDEEGECYTQKALITCSPDESGKRLEPKGVLVWEDYLESYTTAYGTSFGDYQKIRIPATARKQTQNDRGELLAFDEWEAVDSGAAWEMPIDGSWTFALLNDTLPREDLFVSFQLRDSQNNAYSSTLYPVTGRIDETVSIRLEYNNDEIETLTLDTDHFFARIDDGNMRLSGPVIYAGEGEIIVNVENLTVNQTSIGSETAAVVYGAGPNWGMLKDETQPMSIVIGVDQLTQGAEYQEITFDLVALDAVTNEVIGTVPVTAQVESSFLFAEKA